MKLTERQRDALSELINIAFARTGAALSDLTGHRVLLNPPEVAVYRTAELRGALAKFVPGDVASIHQVFAGPVAGDAWRFAEQATSRKRHYAEGHIGAINAGGVR